MMCEFEQNRALVVSEDFSKDGLEMEFVSAKYGCKHYQRRCKNRAPCCDEIFDCRYCHNEAKNALEIDPINPHDVPRHLVKRVQQNYTSCGSCMGDYFCNKCNFFDDDVSEKQYHCDECGRIGRRENFFRCGKCGRRIEFILNSIGSIGM